MCSIMLNIYNLVQDCDVINLVQNCDVINLVAAFLPALSTVASVVVYPFVYPTNDNIVQYAKKRGVFDTVTMQPGLISLPFILFVTLPLSDQTVRLNWSVVATGMFFVDTAEYWRHRLEHLVRFLYKHAHKKHHQQRPVTTLEAFKNQKADLLVPLIPFTMYTILVDITFLETMVLAALSIVATYADHTMTGNKEYDKTKFHNVHHTTGWNNNFQQPFFSYWDDLCGTRAHFSSDKWCPFIP